MGIYVALIIITILYSGLLSITRLPSKKIIYIMTMGVLYFVVSGFRSITVGTDLPRYIERFFIIGKANFSEFHYMRERWKFEYGYLILNKLVHFVSENERLLIIISSSIIIGAFCFFIYKNSKVPWFSFYLFIVLYFYGTSFNLIRMFLAISICLISIEFIKKNKHMKFLLLILIASCFHITALAFILLYPISKLKINKVYLILITVLFIGVLFANSFIIKKILPTFGYEGYLNELGTSAGYGMLLLLLIILVSVVALEKTNLIVDIDSKLWLHMIVIAIGFNVLSLELWVAARVMWYFKVALLIIIPNVIVSIKNTKLRFIVYIFGVMLPLVYFYLDASKDNAGIIPYLFM